MNRPHKTIGVISMMTASALIAVSAVISGCGDRGGGYYHREKKSSDYCVTPKSVNGAKLYPLMDSIGNPHGSFEEERKLEYGKLYFIWESRPNSISRITYHLVSSFNSSYHAKMGWVSEKDVNVCKLKDALLPYVSSLSPGEYVVKEVYLKIKKIKHVGAERQNCGTITSNFFVQDPRTNVSYCFRAVYGLECEDMLKEIVPGNILMLTRGGNDEPKVKCETVYNGSRYLLVDGVNPKKLRLITEEVKFNSAGIGG